MAASPGRLFGRGLRNAVAACAELSDAAERCPVIRASGIPTIDGDMDALAEHARAISAVGAEFAGTGAQVQATWQGLGAVYDAPEAGQLIASMGPVAQVSASVGEDLETVGQALAGYAAEVKDIQARLAVLRQQAAEFEQSLGGDAERAGDDGNRERNDELIAAVDVAVADFNDAERRCANAIGALYGGQSYRADDGDGRAERGEYGATAEQFDRAAGSDEGLPWGANAEDDPGWLSTIGHGVLDVAGLVPVLGEPADAANAAWYTAEGDYTNAALSAAAMVPLVGWAATGGKFGVKGVRAVRSLDGARAWMRGRPSMVPAHAEKVPFIPNDKFQIGERYVWRDPETGKRVQYHAHGVDPGRPASDNAGQGAIYRVRVGNHYLDGNGNLHTRNAVDPNSPAYNPKAANDTHIPYPKDQPPPGQPHRRVAVPNPAAFVGPDRQEN